MEEGTRDKQMCTICRLCLRWHTLKNCTHARTHEPTYFVRVLQVVVVDLLDGLEVNHSFRLGLVFVCGR